MVAGASYAEQNVLVMKRTIDHHHSVVNLHIIPTFSELRLYIKKKTMKR